MKKTWVFKMNKIGFCYCAIKSVHTTAASLLAYNRATSLMLWTEDKRWKPSDDLSNQEKNQYGTVY